MITRRDFMVSGITATGVGIIVRFVAQPIRTKAIAAMMMADRAPGEGVFAMHLGARLDMAAKQIDRGSAFRRASRGSTAQTSESPALQE